MPSGLVSVVKCDKCGREQFGTLWDVPIGGTRPAAIGGGSFKGWAISNTELAIPDRSGVYFFCGDCRPKGAA